MRVSLAPAPASNELTNCCPVIFTVSPGIESEYRMKSETRLFVKILGFNGLEFAYSKFDNLTE